MAELTSIARILAEDWERHVERLRGESRCRERPFVVDWPALAQWRDSVLREPRRHPAHIVAAALEAMALECQLAGYPELAERACAKAEAVVLGQSAARAEADQEMGQPL